MYMGGGAVTIFRRKGTSMRTLINHTFTDRARLISPRFAVLALVAAAVSTMLTGCNTTEGVGKDVKSLGKGIEETAQDAKN